MVRGLEHTSCERQAERLEVVQPREKKTEIEQHSNTYGGTYKGAGEGVYTKACSERTRGNCFKL